MELIRQIAGLWNEFLIVGICSGVIGAILAGIMAILAEKLKIISSIVVAIPMSIALLITRIAWWLAVVLGIIQLVLNIL